MDISRKSGEQTREQKEPAGRRELARSVLDALDSRIAVVDSKGVVIAVNAAWKQFAEQNRDRMSALSEGQRYLEVCARACGEACGEEAEYALRALTGVQSVINRTQKSFEMEYPCHTSDGEQWFLMRVTPLADGSGEITVAHYDISCRKFAEQRLRKQEERLDDIISTIPGIVFQFVKRPDGSFAIPYFSSRAHELTGISPDQIDGNPELAFQHIHPDDRSIMFALIDQSARALSQYSVDLRLKTLNGGYRWFHFESMPRLLDDGAVIWNGVAIDIMERKQAEEALKNEAVRRRILVEQSRDGIVVLDETGKVYEANQRYADTLGYTMEEVLQLHVWDWDTQWSRERLLKMIRTVDETGDRFETRHRRRDGSLFDVEISTNGAVCDGRKLVFCVCRDITNRKRIEEALRESESRLQALSDASFEAIFFSDKGVCLDQNKAAERMFGYSYEEAIGRHGTEWIAPEDRVRVNNAMMSGYEKPYRVNALRKDGSTFPAEIQGRMFEYQGRPIRVTALRDITSRNRAEEALKTSEERYRLLANNTLDVIWLMDMTTRFTYVNPSITAMFGYTPEEFIGTSLADHCDEEQMKRMTGIIANEMRRLEENRGVIFETIMRRRDGSLIPVEIHGAFLLDSEGRPVGLQGTTRDISERKRNEAIQRESEERYKLTFDTSPDSININRLEDGLYVDINQGFTTLTGFTRDDVIGKTSLEIGIWHDERDREELVRGLKEKGYYENLEAQFRMKDGGLLTALMSARLISLGGVPHIITVTRDISERKRAEEALRDSEERFKILSEQSPLGMALIGRDGRYEYVNPAFVEMFGYSPDEIQMGREWFGRAFPDPEYREEVVRTWLSDLDRYPEGEVRSRDYEVTCKDGTRKTILFRPVTISQGKQFVIYEDITRQRKLEAQLQQAQKMEAIGILAGGVSHDFNNLLQAIDGYTQLLLFDKNETDQEYTSLQAIQTACDRAAQLVRQLLLFSRKSATDRKPLEINREFEQARRLLERAIPRMIDIEVHPDADLWPVKADPVQIEQIFLNLGINAADAMPDGGKLVIETENVTLGDEFDNNHPGAEPGRYALITVSDTGYGMDKETLKHIFEPFYTTKEIGKGTGLGLASVYGIVKSHEGYITCYSEPGRGSTFKIYLPAMEQMEAGGENFLEEEISESGEETILLVDDEASVRDMASSALKRFGYTVLTASNGEEALQVYTNLRDEIDLVIMDLGMPGMGGAKCMRKIMRFNPSAKIVIASGYSANSLVKDTLEAGAAGYIGKPYRLAQLLKQVRTILDGQ